MIVCESKYLFSFNFYQTQLFAIVFLLVTIGIIFVNPDNSINKLLTFSAFLSFLLFFQISCHTKFDISFFRVFLFFILILEIYQFLICLNQRFNFFESNWPLIPNSHIFDENLLYDYESEGSMKKVRNSGTLPNFEAFGELSQMISVFFFVIFSEIKVKRINYNYVGLIILFSSLNVFLSGTRSSIILMSLSFIVLIIRNISSLLNNKLFTFSIIFLIVLFPVIFDNLGFSTIANRFSNIEVKSKDISEISGRAGTFKMGINALENSSLFVGNGYALANAYYFINNGSNGILSPTSQFQFMDAHNLYLTLPLYFGWLGSILFISIFIYLIRLLIFCKGELSFAFIIMWITFLLNEFKIVFIRDSNFFSIIMVLLGLSFAYVYNSSKFQ